MKARLYGLPGSHPTMAVQAMLEYKGIDFRRIDLVPFLSRVIVRRAMGLPQNTVPVLTIDGRRIQGSRAISRELERLRPEPPLFPSDAGAALRGGGGRALGRGGAPAPDPAGLALGDASEPGADPQLHGGFGHGRPDRPRRPPRPALHRIAASASTRRPTRPSGPTSPRSTPCWAGSTSGSPRASSTARS